MRKVVAALFLTTIPDAFEFFFEIVIVPHELPMLADKTLTFPQEPLHGFQDFLLSVRCHDTPKQLGIFVPVPAALARRSINNCPPSSRFVQDSDCRYLYSIFHLSSLDKRRPPGT
jgi:hypothetical protein